MIVIEDAIDELKDVFIIVVIGFVDVMIGEKQFSSPPQRPTVAKGLPTWSSLRSMSGLVLIIEAIIVCEP